MTDITERVRALERENNRLRAQADALIRRHNELCRLLGRLIEAEGKGEPFDLSAFAIPPEENTR